MGKTNKRTAKLLKQGGKRLEHQLKKRKENSKVGKQKAVKASKFAKSLSEHLERKAEEDDRREVEEKASEEADKFVQIDETEKAGGAGEVWDGSDDEDEDVGDESQDEMEEDSEGSDIEETFSDLGDVVDTVKAIDASSSSENEEDDDVKMDNKKLKDGISKHKSQLEALKEQDPEFYQYLQKADEKLLDFGEEDDEEDDSDSDEEGQKRKPKVVRELTPERVDELCKAAIGPKGSVSDLRLLLGAYRSACMYGDDSGKGAEVLTFSNAATYTKVMMFVLKEVDGIFRRLLGIKKDAGHMAIKKAMGAKKVVQKQVLHFFWSSLRLLKEPLDGRMCGFVLRRLKASVALLLDQKPLCRRVLLCALGFFASDAKNPRLQAIMLIREMALTLGEEIMDMCMKGVYRTFSSKSHLVNPQSIIHLNFMATCVIEIFGLNPEAAYRHAFAFIRNLAVELREAISEKKDNSISKVFSWRYINCLELWARLVSAHLDKGDMRHLVYPVAQLLLGVIKFRQQKKHLPTRLRIVRTLNGLSAATGYYIPVSSFLLGILQWPALGTRVTKLSDDYCPDLSLQLKVPKPKLKSSVFQAEVVEQVFELLSRHLAQWSHSIAFPEQTYWICFHLRKFSRSAGMERYRKLARQVIVAAEQSAENIQRRRDVVDFSPKDLQKIDAFEKDGQSAGQTPLMVVASDLEKQHKTRQDMRTETDWKMEEGEEDSEGGDDENDGSGPDSGEEELDDGENVRKAVQKGLGSSGIDHGDQEDEDGKLSFALPQIPGEADVSDGEDEADVVGEFVLSDEEEKEGMEEPAQENGVEKKEKKKKKKSGKVKGTGDDGVEGKREKKKKTKKSDDREVGGEDRKKRTQGKANKKKKRKVED
ncbi:hypothetical protein BSKO_01144 [Bryopsis sp. KO-2023]|nr:hypothetical protein BSKO_01144 [Bryopsis sp. KO-2023]